MLRKWMLLPIVFVVLSLVAAPGGEAHADPAGWRPAAGTGPFEPDDTPAQAKPITDGVTQSRSIVPGTDVDWIRFQIPTTAGVILETSGPLPSDTYMSLFMGNLTPVEFSDDEGPGFYSSIDRVCGVDPLPAGTYYVKIEEYHNRAQIQNYNLFFNTAPCPAEVVDIYASVATTGPTADKQGSSILGPHASTRRSFPGLNKGPLQIVNRGANPMMAGQRIIYKVNGVNISFSEMMAQPNRHLDTVYWLPWYNNIDLDSQLRIANTTTSAATVQVLIGNHLPPEREMPDNAVFISYAREDLPAVQRLKAGLDAAGVRTWFDLDRLEGGDDYDRKIQRNIARCSYFVPVVSATTERRLEGYFRREWSYAIDRARNIAEGALFIVPVCIDDTDSGRAHVPDKFKALHITRLPGGDVTAEFAQHLKDFLTARH